MNKRIKKKKRYNYLTGTAKTRKYNKWLCKRYPFLIPRNVWTDKIMWGRDKYFEARYGHKEYIRFRRYSYTLVDEFMPGWWKAFGLLLCEELREDLIKCGYLYKFRFEQIKEKYGCYDSETEILTENGWKYFKDLSFQERIATLNQNTEELEYQYPTDIIAEKYSGRMYRLENRGVSLCVTPNHNLYVSKGSYFNGAKNNEKRTYDFELVNPDKYFGKDKRFKKGCIWNGYNPYGNTFKIKGLEYDALRKKDDVNSGTRHYILSNREYDLMSFLRFLGFYIAEGCTNTNKSGKVKEISIAYNGLDEEELVCELLEGIGYSPCYGTKDGSRAMKRIYDSTLGRWLIDNCGHLAPNKKVPEFIKTLPPAYINEFLTYLYIGDGHKTETYNVLSTTSKQLSDDVQELLIKCGFSFRHFTRDVRNDTHIYNGRVIKSNHISHEINWLKNTEIEIDMSKAKRTKSFREEWIDYSGSVYCVSVPNHIVYIRRNGKGIWCGNSQRMYSGGVPRESDAFNIIEKYTYLSNYICQYCGKPDTHQIDDGWIMTICEDCYNKMNNTRKKYRTTPIIYNNLPGADNDATMPTVRKVTQFSKEGNKTIEYDITETVNKIRAKWRG